MWEIAANPHSADTDWKPAAQDTTTLLAELAQDAENGTFADQEDWADEISDVLLQDLDIDRIAYQEVMRLAAHCMRLLETASIDEAEATHEFIELALGLNARRWGYGGGTPIFVPDNISTLFDDE